ncbi:MAG: S-layer homology domain-containing protein [Bacillota bacterium]|nr:S-layer homology domain-containing protein [Bacillota bacterium]
MRKSKRIIALIMTIAFLFSIAAPAFAADAVDYSTAIEQVGSVGAMIGDDNGFRPNDTLTRAEFATIAARVSGYNPDQAAATATDFSDVPASHWASDAIAYAAANGIVVGMGDGTFAPDNKVTYAQVVTMLVRVLGYGPEADKLAWPTGYELKGYDLGLITAAYSGKAAAIRGEVAVATATTIFDAVNAEGEKISEVVYGIVPPAPPVEFAIDSFDQVGVKKLEVTFNEAVEEGTLALKRGQINVPVKAVTWSEDKKVATIETTTNLLAEDYTVSINDVSATVKAAAGKVAKIELNSDSAVQKKENLADATVKFAVYNQFGEDVTKSSAGFNWIGTPNATVVANYNSGTLTITNTGAAWEAGKSQVVITGVDTTTGAVANGTVTIQAPSKIMSLNLLEVKNIDGDDQLLNQGDATAAKKYFWVISFEAVDQYGNAVTAKDYFDGLDNAFNNADDPVALNVSASGSTVTWAADPKAATKAVLQITPGGGTVDETVVVTAVDKTSGANGTITFKVEKDAGVKTFTMSSPADAVIAGEAVKIPFDAVDQYGNVVTKYSGLNGVVTVTTSNGAVAFVEDPITKEVTLELTPATNGTAVLTSTVGTSVSTLTLTASKLAVPTVVDSISSKAVLKLTNNATATLDKDSFVVKDQYGRDIKLGTYGADVYTIVVAEDDGADTDVSIAGGPIAVGGGSYTLTGTANAGAKAFTAKLQKNAADVAGSSIAVTAETVAKASLVEFKMEEISGKLLATGTVGVSVAADYAKDVKVFGYTADGSKVALHSASYIQAVNVVGQLNYAAGKVNATTITKANTEETGTILVAVNGNSGVVTLRQDVTITDAAPKAEKIEIKKGTLAAGEKLDGNVVALLAASVTGWNAEDIYQNTAGTRTAEVYFVVTDQYGVKSELDPSFYYINEDDVTTSGTYSIGNTTGTLAVGAGVAVGDEVTITAVTTNGLSASLKVLVK